MYHRFTHVTAKYFFVRYETLDAKNSHVYRLSFHD